MRPITPAPRPLLLPSALLLGAALLTGCGGGGGGEAPPAPIPAPNPGPSPNPSPSPSPSPSPTPSPSPSPAPSPSASPTTPSGQAADCGFANFSAEVMRLVNEQRLRGAVCGAETMPAVPALAWNAALGQSSARHADDMAQRSFFDHTGSDGSNAGQRMVAAGYTDWRAWGENIAYGQSSPASVVDGWMKSPGHCRNIMSSGFKEMGQACLRTSNTQYRIFWVQNFGRR